MGREWFRVFYHFVSFDHCWTRRRRRRRRRLCLSNATVFIINKDRHTTPGLSAIFGTTCSVVEVIVIVIEITTTISISLREGLWWERRTEDGILLLQL